MARTPLFTCLIVISAVVFSTSCNKPKAVVIGAKNFTEQNILAEIIAQHVERKLAIPVERRFNLGGTLLAHQSVITGAIDLYPEYTGTALLAILKQDSAPDPATTLQKVRQEYSRLNVEWLPPLGFNNSFAMVIPGDLARKRDIKKLSDAPKYSEWQLGVGYEFSDRKDGYANLVSSYDIKQKEAPRSMDLGLLYKALEQNQVNMVAANMTDGMLAKMDVKILDDDKKIFPPYEACIVVRSEALRTFPELRPTLEQLSGKISGDEMRKLNYMADVEHKPIREIASAFLSEAGL
jgi:glycine betaine/choline ABC-type transport system substrate-binding protein